MDFNLKNYNAVNINIHSKRFTTHRRINKLNSSLNYDFLQVITLLKNNQEDVQKVSFNISSLRKQISFPDIEIQKRHSKNKI